MFEFLNGNVLIVDSDDDDEQWIQKKTLIKIDGENFHMFFHPLHTLFSTSQIKHM